MKSAFIDYRYSKIALVVFAVSSTLSTMVNANVCTTMVTDTNNVSCLSSATPTCGDPSIASGQCAVINSNGMVNPSSFSAAISGIGLDAFSESFASVLSKVTHTNGNPISINLLNPTAVVGAVGVRAANRYNVYPDDMESKIDVNGDITVKATSTDRDVAWVYGVEGQSTGTRPTTINYDGLLNVDAMGVTNPLNPVKVRATVIGIKATPNSRYGVGDVVVNIADDSSITVKSNSSAQGIAAEALLGRDSGGYIYTPMNKINYMDVTVGKNASIRAEGSANGITAAVSLKRLPILLDPITNNPVKPPLLSNPEPPFPQPTSIINFKNGGKLSSSSDLVVRGESTTNTTTNVNNTGSFIGYVTMSDKDGDGDEDGNDNISNAGKWVIQNCSTSPCSPAIIHLGAGINTINNTGLMTAVRTGSSTDSNQVSIKSSGGVIGTLTMENAGIIDMQEKLPLLSDASGLLTVEGSFKANGGSLNLDTKLAGDGAPSDILKVAGNITKIASPTTIIINDVGILSDAAATGNVATGGIPLIKYSGYSSTDDAFVMANRVKGDYTYRLFNDAAAANQMWKLIALKCSISHSEYYPESDIKISCTGLFPGEQITIPVTNCTPGAASATGTLECVGKGKNVGSTPSFTTVPPSTVPSSSAVTVNYTLTSFIPVCSPNPAGSLYSNESVTVTCSGVKPGDSVTYNGVTIMANPSGKAVFPTTAGVVVTKPQATINTSSLLTVPTIQPIAVTGITLLSPSCAPSPTGPLYSNEPVIVICSGVKPGDFVTYNGVTVIADASGKAVFTTTAGVVATTPTATIPGQPALGVTGVTLLTPSCAPSPTGSLYSNDPVTVTCTGVKPGDPVTYNGVIVAADASGKAAFPTTAGVVIANPTATVNGLGGPFLLPVILKGFSLTAIPVNSNYVLLMLVGLLGVIGAFGIRHLPKR